MGEEEQRKPEWVYKALGHPDRTKIIEIIGKNGKSGFKELHESLKVSVGTLYYHIDMLDNLITQDSQRKYVLTEKGKFAYKLIETMGEKIHSLSLTEAEKPKGLSNLFKAFQNIFLPARLFLHLSNRPFQYLPTAAVIIIFGAWTGIQAHLEYILILPNTSPFKTSTLLAASFIASWFFFFALCNLLVTLFFHRKHGNLALLVGSAFSFLPLIAFSCIWYMATILNFIFTTIETSFLLLFFQAWTIGLMSTSISLSKGLRIDKAALICIVIAYMNIVCFLLIRSI
jgi:hypothetical protein